MRVGSLASGCGALDLALQQVLPDAELAWVCENDRHASTVLAARFPGVPNLNDVTAIDHTAPPVDILIGGLPCQPYSVAGKQKGKADNRDLLPESIRLARLLEPRLIFLENVSNLVRKPEFRALAGGMAEIGYDIRWTTLRASDVGACHRRDRLFAVAYPHSEGRWEVPGSPYGDEEADAGGTEKSDHQLGGAGAGRLLPTPNVSDAKGGSPSHHSTLGDMVRHGDDWGEYAEAINRHEAMFGTPPSEPMDDKNRLEPAFVEWMLCIPRGWVTDLNIPRTAQLKILGNAVVPPQAAEAYRRLLNAAC